MTRLKDATFEDGSLTGTKGATSTTGTVSLDATGAVKGAYAASYSVAGGFSRFDITASAEVFVSAYIYVTSFANNVRSIYVQNGLRLDIRSTGRLRLADAGGTQIGSDSGILSTNTLYRVGVHYKKGTGSDGIARAYVTATGSPEAAFGSPFAETLTHTPIVDISRVDVGNTAGATANAWLADNIRIDNTAMPAADGTPTLLDDLVGYWKLDETSGNRASEVNSYTLTDRNTVGNTTGKISNAANFVSGNSEALSIADNANLSAGNVNIQIGAWVKLTSKVLNMLIVGKWHYTGSSREYDLGYDQASDRFIFKVSTDGASGTVVSVAANNLGSPSTGTWYYLQAWHDAAANTLNISVNDGTVDSTSHSGGIFDGTSDFTIGAMYQSADDYLDGAVDEVGVWKRILTSTERTFLYNSGTGRTHPFASSTDTPKAVNVTVSTTLTIGPKAIGKPIALAVTAVTSVLRVISFIKALIITVLVSAIKAKPVLVELVVNSAATIQKTILKPIDVAVTSTINRLTAYSKIITQAVTSTVNITKAFPMLITRTVTSTPTLIKNVSKIITQTIILTTTFLKGLVTLKTITYAVTSTINFTKGIVTLKNITYAVTSTISFAKGMVNLKTVTLSVTSTVPTVVKNIGKPIIRTVAVTLTRITTIPKNVLISVTPIVSLHRDIAKNIIRSVTSTITAIVGKGYFRTAEVIVTASSVIQKNILKPIAIIESVVVSLQPKNIGKTLTAIANITITAIHGNLILKTIEVVVSSNISKMIGLDKTILFAQATAVSVQRSLTLLIVRTVNAPVILSVHKGIGLTKNVLVNAIEAFSKQLSNQFTNTYFRKNVRALTLGFKNSALSVLGKNTRTIDLQDTNES